MGYSLNWQFPLIPVPPADSSYVISLGCLTPKSSNLGRSTGCKGRGDQENSLLLMENLDWITPLSCGFKDYLSFEIDLEISFTDMKQTEVLM